MSSSSFSAHQQAEHARTRARQQQREAAEVAAMSQPRLHGRHDAPLASASAAASCASVAPTGADQLNCSIQADGERQMMPAYVASTPQPQQAAADASTQVAAGVSLAVQLPRLSVAQRCHNDALHSIFAFLSLKEIVPVVQSCRAWCHAAYAEPCRQLERVMAPEGMSTLIAPLQRVHTICVEISDACNLQQLSLFSGLTRLVSLTVTIKADSVLASIAGLEREDAGTAVAAHLPPCREYDLQMQWPERLTNASFSSTAVRTHVWQTLLDALAMHARVQKLHVRPSGTSELQWPAMPQLKLLEVQDVRLEACELTGLRQMKSLLDLRIENELTVDLLRALSGHPSLQYIRALPSTLDAEHVNAMSSMPALVNIPQACFSLDALPLLATYAPNLTCACIDSGDRDAALALTRIIPQLAACRALASLELANFAISAGDLAALAAACPLLVELQLSRVRLTDAHALSALAACSNLRFLRLSCRSLSEPAPFVAHESTCLQVAQRGVRQSQYLQQRTQHLQQMMEFWRQMEQHPDDDLDEPVEPLPPPGETEAAPPLDSVLAMAAMRLLLLMLPEEIRVHTEQMKAALPQVQNIFFV